MSDQQRVEGDEADQPLPKFVTPSNVTSPFFYFHHRIDVPSSTLTVEVVGPNLSFKFSHKRARRTYSGSKVAAFLEQKTVGFLTHVASDGKRVILASAESGHGLGIYGDMLDSKPGVLSNRIWTKRVVRVGMILGMNMRRPFDHKAQDVPNNAGMFQGSHVEVKLAVHAVFVLLDMFKITRDFDNITRDHLVALRHARWEDGSRPVFEVYFSRKNCVCCGLLTRKLEELTGVTLRLCWKPRLEMKKYIQRAKSAYVPAPGSSSAPAEEIMDDQDMDFGDDIDAILIPDDDEIVSDDTTEEEVRELELIDLTNHPSLLSEPPTPEPERDLLFDYLDGLAFRVGQIDSAQPVVEFARKMVEQYHRQKMRRQNSQRLPDERNISKPLPAMPAIEPPAWMLAQDSGERSSDRAEVSFGWNEVRMSEERSELVVDQILRHRREDGDGVCSCEDRDLMGWG